MEHKGHQRAVWAAVGVLLLVGAVLAVPVAARGTVNSRTGPPANGKNMPGVYTCATLQECNALLDTTQTPGIVKKVVLTADITGVVGNGIVIKRDNVVFDGGGKKITGTSTGNVGEAGIDATYRNGGVVIRNVEVRFFDIGVNAEYSIGVEIKNNILRQNLWGGIFIGAGTGYEISGNDIGSGLSEGINAWSVSNSVISNNTFDSNAGYGIIGAPISNSEIFGNTFQYNSYGAKILGSGNQIYHNNFISNGFDAINSGSNSWFKPYDTQNPKLGGGNFWLSNSPCQDLYDGSTTPQTSGQPDGICDDSYTPPTNGLTDIFPFVAQNGWQ